MAAKVQMQYAPQSQSSLTNIRHSNWS